MFEALNARNWKCLLKIVVIVLRPTSFRAFSASQPQLVSPGPMAQSGFPAQFDERQTCEDAIPWPGFCY